MSFLEIESMGTCYGDFQALHDVSLKVEEGEVFGIIGANGAGKSTLLQTVAGLLSSPTGALRFNGESIERVAAEGRVARGISLVPEGRRVFPSLTVRENLLVGGHRRRKGPWTLDGVIELFPLLEKRIDTPAGVLSGGEQQALAIGRALMANPSLLMLDEVSLGLAPVIVRGFYDRLGRIVEAGTTLLVVEQDIGQVMRVADRVACLLEGRVRLSGIPKDLTRAQITAAYFGV